MSALYTIQIVEMKKVEWNFFSFPRSRCTYIIYNILVIFPYMRELEKNLKYKSNEAIIIITSIKRKLLVYKYGMFKFKKNLELYVKIHIFDRR